MQSLEIAVSYGVSFLCQWKLIEECGIIIPGNKN